MSTRELTGKVAVITGVGRSAGIGAAIARELAQAGAKLFLLYYQHHLWSGSFRHAR